VLGAGRRRLGTVGAGNRRRGDRLDRTTNCESAYGRRRIRQEADDARKGDETGVSATARVAHLACTIAFTLVMHRTDLTGQQSRTADFVVVGDGDRLAAERQRRGDNAGQLAREPETDHPRQAPADESHEDHHQLNMPFVGMMPGASQAPVSRCAIQFAVVIATFLACFAPAAARAQDADSAPPPQPPPDHHHTVANSGAWTWSTDANVIAGYNYQDRKFADFWAYESQNWFMGMGERRLGPGTLTLNGMISLEPWTIGRFVYAHGLDGPERVYAFDAAGRQQPVGASPQAFQTGESYLGSPLINFQHPHDFFMGLGAAYHFTVGRLRYAGEVDPVGSPALGPTVYMHRESGRDNPSTPLTHHYLDSTHITYGVVTGGVQAGPMLFEASTFRGEEPDENRTNLERPKLDSWSARATWRRGPWDAQFSGGHLHVPEWFEPTDVTRLTASIGFNGAVGKRPLAVTAAWGQNRELNFALDGYLLEWDLHLSPANTVYGRGESVLKEIFGLGVHPAGLLNHPRNFSQINALTVGYIRDLPMLGSSFGIGADITVYDTSQDLVEFYGSPHSYHVFLRWRPNRAMPAHVH
jgi:hypothetical protein